MGEQRRTGKQQQVCASLIQSSGQQDQGCMLGNNFLFSVSVFCDYLPIKWFVPVIPAHMLITALKARSAVPLQQRAVGQEQRPVAQRSARDCGGQLHATFAAAALAAAALSVHRRCPGRGDCRGRCSPAQARSATCMLPKSLVRGRSLDQPLQLVSIPKTHPLPTNSVHLLVAAKKCA